MLDLQVDERVIEEQVRDFMRSCSLSPHDGNIGLKLDGQVHRYTVEGDKAGSDNGYYCIYTDGCPAGYIGSWKTGGESIRWKFDMRDLPVDASQRLKMAESSKAQKEAQVEREKARLDAQALAEKEAERQLCHMVKADANHPYLKKKCIQPHGIFMREGKLVVPLVSSDGNILRKSYQVIAPDGEKRFFPGVSTSGLCAYIGGSLRKDTPLILICEGFATGASVFEMTGATTYAAMNCGNLYAVARNLKEAFPKTPIIIAADNDARTQGNPGLTKAREAAERLGIAGVVWPEFPEIQDGTDWNDFAKVMTFGEAQKDLKRQISAVLKRSADAQKEKQKKPEAKEQSNGAQKLSERVAVITANELLTTEFPEMKWAVEGFLPSGCSILCGGPKVGKSILALHLALSIAIGGVAMGSIEVERGDVLYLALEDTKRRLKTRILESGISEMADLSKLTLVTEIPRQHEGGALWVDDWLTKHRGARFVIIDTLQKFRKPHAKDLDRYGSDYDAVSEIKKVADKHDVSALIIHHTKKAKDEDDWLNEVSGTQGLAGAADTLLFLKRGRLQNVGIMRMTGRDVEESEYAMTLDGFGWRLEGDADTFTLNKDRAAIIAHLGEAGMQTAKEVSECLGMNINTTKTRLRRMQNDGQISGYGGRFWVEGK